MIVVNNRVLFHKDILMLYLVLDIKNQLGFMFQVMEDHNQHYKLVIED